MMRQIYLQAHAASQEATHTQEAVIVRARFGAPAAHMQPLSLTLYLSSPSGTVLAVYSDVADVINLLRDLDADHPEQLQGKKVHAHFSARKLIGISA